MVSKDVKFEENLASRKSQESSAVTKDEEQQLSTTSSSGSQTSSGEELAPYSSVRRLVWLLQTLRDAGEAPRSVVRESKPLRKFSNYMALMSSIIDVEPSNFEEATNQQVWRDAMVEYTSIMRNDVWDIVPRPKGKSVVSSEWLYKIKHATNGSIEKFKARFVARGFS
jgi:hypothetical protein